MWLDPAAPFNRNEKIVMVLIGAVIMTVIIGWAYTFNLDRAEKDSVCQQAGFDGYSFVIHKDQVVKGQKYITCYSKEVVNGHLNRTEVLIPYPRSGGSK